MCASVCGVCVYVCVSMCVMCACMSMCVWCASMCVCDMYVLCVVCVMHVYVMSVCLCMCRCAHECRCPQKRASDALNLELQVFESGLSWMLGTQQEQPSLNHCAYFLP